MSDVPKPIVLIALDGFGISLERRGNAIAAAEKPTLDRFERRYPLAALQASGIAVGLPWGEAGNSEVGHLTMGAGRVIYHHLPRIITAIQDGSFYENRAFLGVLEHVRQRGSSLHLLGLVSSGSVHSYFDHLLALLELAKRSGDPPVFIHAITDGRDAPPQEGITVIGDFEARLRSRYPRAVLTSLIGRFYAMDRDERWERIRAAYELLVAGRGERFEKPTAYLSACYGRGTTDEFIEPAGRAAADGGAAGRIRAGDGLIFFNFREDSMREITAAFAAEPFAGFDREQLADLKVATMTDYGEDYPGIEAAFPPLEIHWPLARVLAEAGKRQLHIAETEKYAHVTYFFNGGVEKPFSEEERVLVPSLSVPHFDERPEMRTPEITEQIVARWGEYDFILGNFANADMVGHTGNFAATVKAVEVLDRALGRLTETALERGGVLMMTGDHGNAEAKLHPISGEPTTEHTANPVPLYLVGKGYERTADRNPAEILAKKKEVRGILTDIAPTILELLHIAKPDEMTGKSLLPTLLQER